MKKYSKALLYAYLVCVATVIWSCKKDSADKNVVLSGDARILNFTATGQLTAASIDAVAHTASIAIPYTVNRGAVNVNLSISLGATATVNGFKNQGGALTLDLSKPLSVTVTAENGTAVTWVISASTDVELYGLGSVVTGSKSLDKTYSWYIDQYTSGTYWNVNCGPASVTMAIKWADSTFTKTAADARNTYRSTGGWWTTTDIANYLNTYGINWRYTPLPDEYQTMQKYLDQGNLLILCLDNYYLTYNADAMQHVGKFYQVNAPDSGHFIVIKGYKVVDGKIYFDAYDPWSLAITYPNTSILKGLDRYYTSADLSKATTIWWDYAIVVAPKGKVVTAAAGLKAFALPSQVPEQKGY